MLTWTEDVQGMSNWIFLLLGLHQREYLRLKLLKLSVALDQRKFFWKSHLYLFPNTSKIADTETWRICRGGVKSPI